jgi:predicted Zn-dependent protease
VIALLDFPFHNPLGLLWVGLTLGVLPSVLPGSPSPKVTRVVQVFLGVGLLALAGLQVRVAQTRQAVERQYLARHDALHTHTQARELWQAYPFSADLFDLYSKSAIQAASTSPSPEATQELDELLQRDPFDHHLLLARAQLARRAGDVPTVQALLVRYSEVAPLDPERFLRLAQDAFQQGKPEATLQLLGEAGKQPGFNPTQQQRVQSLREQIALIPR